MEGTMKNPQSISRRQFIKSASAAAIGTTLMLSGQEKTVPAQNGKSRVVLVRALDIAYRKPSFAGDRVQVHLKMFEIGGRIGAAGFLAAPGETRPRVCARILLA